ncbi:MAG: DNA cytosine methyltransferase [Pikeienuella sp.]
MPGFYEFFAGGGMVRAGLGGAWTCLFANDFDAKKAMTYQANWGVGGELQIGDINDLTAEHLPDTADMMWGSFPCQDLSLAGTGAGLKGKRSGTFYAFWDLVGGLARDGRAPKIVAVENVVGALTSHEGRDFTAMIRTYAQHGYRVGSLVINANLFVPQSRPRLFVIGVHESVHLRGDLCAPEPLAPFHTPGLIRAVEKLPKSLRKNLLWWNIPTPPQRNEAFCDLIEDAPKSVEWHTAAETKKLLSMMSPVNCAKVDAARRAGRRMVGAIYKRTRRDEAGNKVQRAEVRFDDVAGCLRTPGGGSSRQTIMIVEGKRIRSRLISTRETARLMGLSDDYVLPRNYNEAYHLTGDGVVAPVVRHIADHVFEPLLTAERAAAQRHVA